MLKWLAEIWSLWLCVRFSLWVNFAAAAAADDDDDEDDDDVDNYWLFMT